MSRKLVRWSARGICAALAVACLVVAPAASATTPQPLSPAQAQALIAGPAVQGPSVTRSVSPQEALAAASRPGAVVSIAPGLSLAQAVGLGSTADAVTSTSSLAKPEAAATASTACASTQSGWQWGTWPYEQTINDITYWCVIYGSAITYRSTSVTATGTLCGSAWTASQLISGGVGYTWFVMRASAGWNCPTVIPYVILHQSHYLDTAHNDWGNSAQVGTG
jgi:hypothetical protein